MRILGGYPKGHAEPIRFAGPVEIGDHLLVRGHMLEYTVISVYDGPPQTIKLDRPLDSSIPFNAHLMQIGQTEYGDHFHE